MTTSMVAVPLRSFQAGVSRTDPVTIYGVVPLLNSGPEFTERRRSYVKCVERQKEEFGEDTQATCSHVVLDLR